MQLIKKEILFLNQEEKINKDNNKIFDLSYYEKIGSVMLDGIYSVDELNYLGYMFGGWFNEYSALIHRGFEHYMVCRNIDNIDGSNKYKIVYKIITKE